jgi:aminoglycoside phosphotransferase (APT) family kinase protein
VEMHANQLVVTRELVSELMRLQFPSWAALPVERVAGQGTVNAIFRIGPDLAARLPLQASDPIAAWEALRVEAAASAEFAEITDCPAPAPIGIGSPGGGYPMPWLLQTWVPGNIASPRSADNGDALAADVVALIHQLRMADTRRRPFSGRGRGGALKSHDEWMERCFRESEGLLDTVRARELWSWFRELTDAQTLVMSHTDLIPPNLLVSDGRLVGVLDTGGSSPADPALDLVVAWHLFDDGPRQRIRSALNCDPTEWARSAAWAFHQAMGLVWYYEKSNPGMSALGRSTLDRILTATLD